MDAAHLDQRWLNNDPDNLAWMCKMHHTMLDCGLYPVQAVKMMRDHWQRPAPALSGPEHGR